MSQGLANQARAPRAKGVRFAPSPTGRFHIGNLRTAWISLVWARALNTSWVVRIEDIDQPRVLTGAREQQLADMAALGLVPDVLITQSDFRPRHWQLFREGVVSGQIYPCDCSRKDVQTALASAASAPHDSLSPVYTGHCRPLDRKRRLRAVESLAWRFRMPGDLGREDFIVARSSRDLDRDGLPSESSFVPAYHWACAIDDFDGDHDLLVRGADLESAAPLQRAIQRWVGWLEGESREPAVFHTSLIVQDNGHRLEKRTQGVTLSELEARGLGASRLVELFEASFDRHLLVTAVRPGASFGESRNRLTLSELGLAGVSP